MCRKVFLGFLIFSFVIPSRIYAQQKSAINVADERSFKNEQVYPIAGSDLLRQKDLEVAEFLKNNPGYLEQKKLMKSAWSFAVGTVRSWLAYNFTNDQMYSVASTCRAVGTNCYVFVADDQWNTAVDQNAVDAVVNEFDNHTPANSGKGIYQTCIDTYGDPPNVDADPKIIILILDIIDGFTGSGGYVAGLFISANEVSYNNTEIYYMDTNPADLLNSGGLNSAFGTAAHEFQHMINWNYHQGAQELTFINESLSKSSEIVCGYGASLQSLYANETNHYLFDWRTGDNTLVLNDYGRAQRFSLYLMEQFGISSLKEFVQSYHTHGLLGIEGLKKVLSNHSTSLGKIILNWEIANGLNDLNVNPAFGYSYSPLPMSVGTIINNPNISPTGSAVMNLGAEYYTFVNSSDLNITFSASGPNIIIKAIEIGGSGSRVIDVPVNSPFTDPYYPSVYSTIRFAVIDTNESSSQDYQYQSSGTPINSAFELKWDNTEPTGFLNLANGDSSAVVFNGVSGTKLDSIKIAVRNLVPLPGGVYELGVESISGNKLADFTAMSTLLSPPPVIDPSGTYPYEQPYKNWVNVDFSSQSIPADGDFAVVIPVEGEYPAKNRVMVTTYQSSSSYNSFWYQSSSGNWLYYGVQGQEGYIFLNLIRAYASLITGTKEVIELKPVDYSLQQNYPNPFNPGTKIRYSIPESGNVSLIIYDLMGRKVIELLSGFQNAGSYETEWNGKNEFGVPVTSGMYFYSIKAGSFSQTRKMILMK